MRIEQIKSLGLDESKILWTRAKVDTYWYEKEGKLTNTVRELKPYKPWPYLIEIINESEELTIICETDDEFLWCYFADESIIANTPIELFYDKKYK